MVRKNVLEMGSFTVVCSYGQRNKTRITSEKVFIKKTWNVERDDKKTRENEKPRVFLKKGLWGGGGREKRSKTSLELPETLFCLTDNNTPLKNPRIAGKTVLVVIISKQNNRYKHKKGKSTKKH